jgi:hypothetical protein
LAVFFFFLKGLVYHGTPCVDRDTGKAHLNIIMKGGRTKISAELGVRQILNCPPYEKRDLFLIRAYIARVESSGRLLGFYSRIILGNFMVVRRKLNIIMDPSRRYDTLNVLFGGDFFPLPGREILLL